jgi:hypothetical protein
MIFHAINSYLVKQRSGLWQFDCGRSNWTIPKIEASRNGITQEKPGNVGLNDIAKEIEGRSALSLGDV